MSFFRPKETLKEINQIGIGSLPIITIATAFSGLVISREIIWHMDQALHTVSMVPGFTGQFVVRELGVAIPALLMISKVGASITAEVGSMKITEQLDALKLLRINVLEYLFFPKWIACIISMVCLTLVSVFVTMICAILVATLQYQFTYMEYLNILRKFIFPIDIACMIVKSLAFGAVIPIVSCVYGFRCKGGAEGVGTATTNSVVSSTLIVIVLDFAITTLFSKFLM